MIHRWMMALIDYCFFQKYRPIHLACEIGNFDIVKLLVDHQCNVDCDTINVSDWIGDVCVCVCRVGAVRLRW